MLQFPARVVLAAATAFLFACTTHAHPPREAGYPVPAPIASGRLADIALIDRDTGERLAVYWHNGQRYVAGTPGRRYAIEVTNRSGARVLAVVSVDGVNAVTGETAAWEQSGYVFSPWQRWEVRGWRKSNERVAAFEFTSLSNSYAARTGRPHDVGVIGVALFRERVRPRVVQPQLQGEGYGAAPGRSEEQARGGTRDEAVNEAITQSDAVSAAPRAKERLGTGHGRSESSWVGETEFERARPAPDEIITLQYNSRENLIAAGVIPRGWPPVVEPNPNPFPAVRGYVPDPPH